jgi:hypothetical protein
MLDTIEAWENMDRVSKCDIVATEYPWFREMTKQEQEEKCDEYYYTIEKDQIVMMLGIE